MVNHSKVSLLGRLIITAIFILTTVLPEIVTVIILTARPGLGYALTFTLIRFMLACILYYFIMIGYGWARWIMAVLLMISVAMVVGVVAREAPIFTITVGILYIPSIAVLLCLKVVRPEERIRVRRRRTHST